MSLTFLWYVPNTVEPGHRGDTATAGADSCSVTERRREGRPVAQDEALPGGTPKYTQCSGDEDVSTTRFPAAGRLVDQQEISPHRFSERDRSPFADIQ